MRERITPAPEHVVTAPLLFTKRDAAAYLGVSVTTIVEYMAAGLLTPLQLPRADGKGLLNRTLIAREELEKLVAERAVKR